MSQEWFQELRMCKLNRTDKKIPAFVKVITFECECAFVGQKKIMNKYIDLLYLSN